MTLLVHLGYLTYDFDTCTVHIPNQEVQKEFINCIEDGWLGTGYGRNPEIRRAACSHNPR